MKLINQKKFQKLNLKARKWDDLCAAISEYYEDYDDDGNEIPSKVDGDLGDIGLVAARKTGYL